MQQTQIKTEVSCLSDYLKIIERLKEDYPTGPMLNNPTETVFLYRGMADESYKLIPSVFREQENELDPEEPDRVVKNKTYCAWASEKEILQSFIQEASCYVSLPSNQLLQWAEYAQHYGAPTRFLDWTGNPLVALYFACKDKHDCNAVVWILHALNYQGLSTLQFLGYVSPLEYKDEKTLVADIVADILKGKSGSSDIEYPILYTPYYVDARMSAQNSRFMVWGSKTESFEDLLAKEEYHMSYIAEPTADKCYGDKQEKEFWYRLTVPASRKQSILRELDTVGINEKTLFPGLDGIGRYIEKKYRLDYHELLECL